MPQTHAPASFRPTLSTLFAASLLALAGPATAGDWVTYSDESATRITAISTLGLSDTEEKDLISGDLDRDGWLDLVVVRKVPFSTPGGRANVLFLNERGVLVDRTATLAPDFLDLTDDRDVILADFNGDGWLDVVTATTFGHQPRVYMNLGRDAGGTWLGLDYNAADQRLPTFNPGPQFCAVAVGDVTGEGSPDVYFVDYDNSLEDRLLINNGNGFFTDQTSTRMTSAMSASAFGTDTQIEDMNGDGFRDIVKNTTLNDSPNSVRILYNDGTGNFDHMQIAYQGLPYMVEVADYTGDGRMDFFVVDDSQDISHANTGNDAQGHALFAATAVTNSPQTNGFGGNVKFADLDQDGILDVIVADVDTDLPGCSRRLALLQGQGTLPSVTYTDPLNGANRAWLTNGTYDVEIFDVNKDGTPDLWNGTCAGHKVFIGESTGVFVDGFESGNALGWSGSGP